MSLFLVSLLLLSGAPLASDEVSSANPLALAPLDCPITEAAYLQPGDPEWAVYFVKPKHPPTAASDLLMTITGTNFVRDFAFVSSQGFGGTYLMTTEDDKDARQPMPAKRQPEELMAFHAFRRDAAGGLARIADAPSAGDTAPVAIYIPDVSRSFWYDEKYIDPETGETLSDRVDMAQGLFFGMCRPK